MLTRARNVHVRYEPLPYLRGWLVIDIAGDHFRVRRVDKAEFRAIFRWAEDLPQRIGAVGRRACWMYRGTFFWDDVGLKQHDVHSLLVELAATA
jgi:hypothetical protein